MKLLNVKKSTEKKIRYAVYIMVCILVFGSMVVFGVDVWIKCAILDINNSRVEAVLKQRDDSFKNVIVMYENEDFNCKGDSQTYNMSEVEEYIRVSFFVDSYYNSETKSFVAPLTISETRNIILPFVLMDIVSLITSIVVVMKYRNSKLSKRALSIGLFSFYVVYTQFVLVYSIERLYNVGKYMWLILLGKIAILLAVLVVDSLLEYKKSLPRGNSSNGEKSKKSSKFKNHTTKKTEVPKLSGGKYGLVRKVKSSRSVD